MGLTHRIGIGEPALLGISSIFYKKYSDNIGYLYVSFMNGTDTFFSAYELSDSTQEVSTQFSRASSRDLSYSNTSQLHNNCIDVVEWSGHLITIILNSLGDSQMMQGDENDILPIHVNLGYASESIASLAVIGNIFYVLYITGTTSIIRSFTLTLEIVNGKERVAFTHIVGGDIDVSGTLTVVTDRSKIEGFVAPNGEDNLLALTTAGSGGTLSTRIYFIHVETRTFISHLDESLNVGRDSSLNSEPLLRNDIIFHNGFLYYYAHNGTSAYFYLFDVRALFEQIFRTDTFRRPGGDSHKNKILYVDLEFTVLKQWMFLYN